MDTREELRQAVADFFEVDTAQIGPSFALAGRKIQGSIARASLDALIRRRIGWQSPSIDTANTFGELAAELEPGASGPAASSTATATDIPASVPEPRPTPAVAGSSARGGIACGIDIELIENLPATGDHGEAPFYRANFTPGEIAYCLMQESPSLHFAARWCAKEAHKKCDPAYLRQEMTALEVVADADGAPSFADPSSGSILRLPPALSLSHTPHVAIARVVKLDGTPSIDVRPAPESIPPAAPTPDTPPAGERFAELVATPAALAIASRAL